ncbi:UDP-N-acetylmuramoyl-tripeptide--D-alanyl-D-alanine ligase [Patescibacteria group bacterium]|nr:UDP-N-acetylmuramoyl-tripeptide--D-alanyl-D-alanine ligase [Patescibacteria group bacterium]MCL5409989.1 UDP-N-acetylmuramoyl-tripeptide--D-alanyl-D-alanine ligase [Patescibacteria group bacterium]
MKKIINALVPILDHLYIFQLLEYENWAFLKWFLQHILARNLQKKHQLSFTQKSMIILSGSIFLISLISLSIGLLANSLVIGTFYLFFLLQLSPVFLLLVNLVFKPLENLIIKRLIRQSQRKLDSLPKLKNVAIAGSFAKTSTKEMLYTLLWKKFRVMKTPKSYNTQVAIAQTILSDLKKDTEVFIVEMDAYHPGELAKLTQLAKPQIGLLTAVAPQHLERFGSMDKLIKTQFELATNLPKTGLLFLNQQDEIIKKYSPNQLFTCPIIYFGDEQSTIFASHLQQTSSGLQFNLHLQAKQISINLPLFGTHHVINFLAAAAIAHQLGLSLTEIKQRALLIRPTPHRLEVKQLGQVTMIDNTYNTNPVVANSSLKLLADLPGKQKVLITPGLVELGSLKDDANKKFAVAASLVADKIIIVGNYAKDSLIVGLKEAKFPTENILQAVDFNQAMDMFKKIATPETVVLLENDLPDQYF